jgi:antitoxin MazE
MPMSWIHEFVTPQKSGVINLPPRVRERLDVGRPGVQIEFIETSDGFTVRAVVPVPAEQQWFWTERWQEMEREADADIAAGRVRRADNAEAFLDYFAAK